MIEAKNEAETILAAVEKGRKHDGVAEAFESTRSRRSSRPRI